MPDQTGLPADRALPGGAPEEAVVFEPGFSVRRVAAVVLRHWYLLRGSWPRLVELAYWPTMQMILWGFITLHLIDTSSWIAQAAGVLIAAVLLWDVLFRGQLGASIPFLEEMWSRNLGHLFVSPLKPVEWVVSLFTVSLIRTLIGVLPAAVLALVFYGHSVFSLGLPLAGFFANLIFMGWWLALIVMGLILRHGLGAESLAWAVVFLLAPVSAVYYPIDTLPVWLQPVAWLMPSAHVFEGMRSVLFGNGFRIDLMAAATGLNLLYMTGAGLLFLRYFRGARDRGALLQTGE